ncbi:MAG: TolC family protein [Pseudomonadota bacterium]|nr:TolC family protein [Pseudomonadota bacterium]
MKPTTHLLLLVYLLSLTHPAQSQERLTLSEFLAKVRAQNLHYKIETAKSQAAQSRSTGLAIPAPMVGIIQMSDQSGNSGQGFEVNQSLPFPVKLAAESSARKYAALSQNESRLAQINEILSQAKTLYFSLWQDQEKLALLSEKQNIIKNHIKLSRSSARSDSFAGVHLLKAEYDFDFLESETLAAVQKIREDQIELALFVNADPTQFKITALEPPLSAIPKLESIGNSHQIQMIKYSLESYRAKEREAKSTWFPDLNLRYKEMAETNMAPRSNEVMVSITLPFVFFWQPYSTSQAAASERMQAELEYEEHRRIFDAKKLILISKVESLKKQLDTLKQKLIPKAEKRMKLAHNLAPRDLETLQDHREAMEAFPNLKLKALELRLEYEQAVSNLEKYLP